MKKKKLVSIDYNNKKDVFKFLDKSYKEAFELLLTARNYFNANGSRDKILLNKDDQLVYTLTVSIITTQLTSVISWLLVCKAVENGEFSEKQLDESMLRVPEFNMALDKGDSCFNSLNKHVHGIFIRSCNLYDRMRRIENSVRTQILETI